MPDVMEEGWGDEPAAPPAQPPQAQAQTGMVEGWGDEDAAPSAAVSPLHRHGPNMDPNEGIEDEVDAATIEPDHSGVAGKVAQFNENVTKAAPALTAYELNAVPFGLGPKLAGAAARELRGNELPDLVTGNPLSQDKVAAAAQKLSAENPRAALAGKGVAMAGELASGEGAGGALASLGGKVLPGAARAVEAASKAKPIPFAVLRAGIEGGAYGAAGGAGTAASNDQDVGAAALHGAGTGALLGAGTGAVGGALGKVATKVAEKVSGGAKASEGTLADLLGHGSPVRPRLKAARAAAAAADDIQYVMDNSPKLRELNEKAALGNPDRMERYEEAVKEQLQELSKPRHDAYAAVDAARPLKAGQISSELRAAAARAGETPDGEAVEERLNYWADRIDKTYGKKGPDSAVPILGLRKLVTNAQNEAGPALSAAMPSVRNQRLRQVAQEVRGVLNRQLDAAAAESPQVKGAVDVIKHEDRLYHGLLAMKPAISGRIEQHKLRSPTALKKVLEHTIMSGNPIKGAAVGAAIYGAGEATDSPHVAELGKAAMLGAAGMGGARYLSRHPGGFAALRAAIESAGKLGAAENGRTAP